MIDLLKNRLKSGHVLRYHTVPQVGNGQRLSDHQWRCAMLLMTLWPDTSKEALMYMLLHDAAEYEIGDLPAPAKWANQILAEAYEACEAKVEASFGVPRQLDPTEFKRCRMCDTLELILHCYERIKQGSKDEDTIRCFKNGRHILWQRYKDDTDWPVLRSMLDYAELPPEALV